MAPSNKAPQTARVRPSDVASDTKRHFLPLIRNVYADAYPPHSVLYRHPTDQLPIQRRTANTRPPAFRVEVGDPVSRAITFGILESQNQAATGSRIRVPFICAANERRPGGDWETGCAGYEEKLCRRSNLSATLNNPWPGAAEPAHYPIPSCGGILSDSVVVCRGPHDDYEKLPCWYDLPVVSVAPTRWPKLRENGAKYSFAAERDLIRDKIRGALHICLHNGYDRLVVGDFGLGNGYRNPPQELAEIWRELLLFDPDLRGQFAYVVFIFDDPAQSTTRLILEEAARKESKGKGKGSGSRSSRGGSEPSPGVAAALQGGLTTDRAVFSHVFDPVEVERVLSQPDPRYALQMITT